MQHQRGGVEEPPAKKQKTEENLIPEPEFIANNPSPVTFKVEIYFFQKIHIFVSIFITCPTSMQYLCFDFLYLFM